jgi:hypothetical protein
MNHETQNAGWQPIPLHIDVPEPPKNQPDEAQKKPVENKKDSFVINGEDPREYNAFSDPFKSDDEM